MTVAEAQEYCVKLTKNSGSNFYYSFLFLPRERRQAMYTVYAFCKEVDSAVDDPSEGVDPLQQLTQWRSEISQAYDGTPTHPVTISLGEQARRWQIPQEYFEELISGMEMDLTITRYATFHELYRYCYRVASVVGLICLKVFGTKSSLASDYAINLGMAFQLTNILRDLATDADRGRIYLPQEDFLRFNCSEDDLVKREYSPALLELLQFQCARAREYYEHARQAAAALPPEDRRALTVAEIMRAVYSRILDQIEGSGYKVFGPRVKLSPLYRLSLAAGTWLRLKFPLNNSGNSHPASS